MASSNPRPKSRRKTKVELLNSDLRDEIDERLLSGDSPANISLWLKTEKGEDIGEHALRSHLKRTAGPLKALRGNYYANITRVMAGKLDVLKELHKAAQVQMKRLSIGLEIEESKNTMTSTVNAGMELLRKILLDIANLEMDLGIRKRVSSGEQAKGLSDEQLKDLLITVVKSKQNVPARKSC